MGLRTPQPILSAGARITLPGTAQGLPRPIAPAANDNHRTHSLWRRFVAASMATLFAASLILVGMVCIARAAAIGGQEMTVAATERPVKVEFFRAPGTAKRPSALLLHGGGGFDRRLDDYHRYASAVANQGIDAYLVYYYSADDERGMSAGGADTFTGRYRAWTTLVNDIADHLLKQMDSNGKVGLVGFSNGGILATGVSALNPKINAAVIYYGTEPWPLRAEPKRFPPLLVLHGDADRVIPVEQGHRLALLADSLGSKVDLVVYEGEGHGFGPDIESSGADALRRTLAFLKRELLPGQAQ